MPFIDRDRVTYRRRPSGKWEVIYYIIDGDKAARKFKGGLATRAQAAMWLEAKRKQMEQGQQKDISWQEFQKRYLATRHHKRASSIEQDRISLQAFADSLPPHTMLSDLTRYHIDEFLSSRTAGEFTRARDLRTLKTALNVAVEWGHLRVNPALAVPRINPHDAEIRYLTLEQQGILLTAARDLAAGTGRSQDTPYIYPLVALALRTGMRKGELLNLRWESIDTEAGRIHVENQTRGGQVFRTKSGRIRIVPADATAITALDWWREWVDSAIQDAIKIVRTHGNKQTRDKAEYRLATLTRVQQSPYVFPSFDDPARPMGEFSKAWRNVRTAARVDIRFHDLRHTFAVTCAKAGVPLALVQQLLGHSDIEMTMKYLRFYPDDAVAGVRLPEIPAPK